MTGSPLRSNTSQQSMPDAPPNPLPDYSSVAAGSAASAAAASLSEPPPAYTQKMAEDWWKGLSSAQQYQYRAKAMSLSEREKEKIKIRYTSTNEVMPHDYYFLCLYPHLMFMNVCAEATVAAAQTSYQAVTAALPIISQTGAAAVSVVNTSAHAVAHAASGVVSGGGSSDGCNGGEAVLIGVVAGSVAAAVIAAPVSAAYAAKKTYNSLRNIAQGEKPVRSIARIAGIGGCAFGGFQAGAVVGAILGSIVPGLGTAIGAIVGGIIGAAIGAGVGAVSVKYAAKLGSHILHHNDANAISTTNPTKYKLSEEVRNDITSKYGMSNSDINGMLKALRDEKNSYSSSPFGTDRVIKNDFNQLLKLIKEGKEGNVNLNENVGITVNQSRFFLFKSNCEQKTYSWRHEFVTNAASPRLSR